VNCKGCQQRLGAYLDGELSDGEASALRGHLRTCQPCRDQAESEAAIIHGLRQLSHIDPPTALWQSVRRQLAEQEIADAEAPLHQRAWRRLAPQAWRGIGGGVAAAAMVGLLWWSRAQVQPVALPPPPESTLVVDIPTPVVDISTPVVDISTALSDEAAMIDRSYRDAVAELLAMIADTRSSWTPSYANRYDDRLVALQGQLDAASPGKGKERAWQELMRYLQTSLTRAEIAMEAL
jgi:hypothetical protein